MDSFTLVFKPPRGSILRLWRAPSLRGCSAGRSSVNSSLLLRFGGVCCPLIVCERGGAGSTGSRGSKGGGAKIMKRRRILIALRAVVIESVAESLSLHCGQYPIRTGRETTPWCYVFLLSHMHRLSVCKKDFSLALEMTDTGV